MHDPLDPLTDMGMAAASQHEMYIAWIEAGFTEDQAMALTVAVVVEIVRGATS